MAGPAINFRATSGFVTDNAGQTYCLASDSYPTTRGGYTFGWTSGPDRSRDRTTGSDYVPELAGFCASNASSAATFRVDLADGAGTYSLRMAVGEFTYNNSSDVVTVKDNASTLFTIALHSILAPGFYDATDTFRADGATWHSANAAKTGQVFASTICIVDLGVTQAVTPLAHLSMVKAAAGKRFVLIPS